jgi:CHASE2 domain-containing sensor protein
MHWLGRHRLSILGGICIVVTAVALSLLSAASIPFPGFGGALEQDVSCEGRPKNRVFDFVFLGLDQSTLAFQPFDQEQTKSNRAFELMTAHSYPWSREVWALLLDRLFHAGARLVIFDMIFSPPNEGDPAFRVALDRYRDKVVIGTNFDFSSVREIGGSVKNIPPNASLIPPPQLEDDRVGYAVFLQIASTKAFARCATQLRICGSLSSRPILAKTMRVCFRREPRRNWAS